MIALQVARIFASMLNFLEGNNDEPIDADDAVQMIEWMVHLMQELDKDFLRELIDAFPIVALEFPEERQESVRNISRDCFLEEALFADDPEALAALEARRDAEEG